MNSLRRIMPHIINECGTDDRAYSMHRNWLCWNVKMHTGPSFNEVWEKMCEEHYINEAEAITRIPSTRNLHNEWVKACDQHYDWAIEHMRSTFTGDDTMQYVTPERAKKWGVTPLDNRFDTKFEFVGRSGGWLALTHIMGMPIDSEMRTSKELDYEMPKLVDNWRLPYLYAMMEEITDMVSNRYDELLYQMAYNMRYNMPDVVPE